MTPDQGAAVAGGWLRPGGRRQPIGPSIEPAAYGLQRSGEREAAQLMATTTVGRFTIWTIVALAALVIVALMLANG